MEVILVKFREVGRMYVIFHEIAEMFTHFRDFLNIKAVSSSLKDISYRQNRYYEYGAILLFEVGAATIDCGNFWCFPSIGSKFTLLEVPGFTKINVIQIASKKLNYVAIKNC